MQPKLKLLIHIVDVLYASQDRTARHNEPCFLRRVARLLAAAFFPSLFSNADFPRLVICVLRGSVNMGQR